MAAILLLVPLGMAASDAPCELPAADMAAVRSANLAYPAAWEKNDGEAVMRVFSEDAVLMPHHGANRWWARGPSASTSGPPGGLR
ncbi:MAG TPA: hypothetical protein VNK82_12915 [Terriglobales bacterium]|nr:hypothetical protein [Terriglobales bacterium]